jgi:diguanylate cyclase (GGDEF)-like protein
MTSTPSPERRQNPRSEHEVNITSLLPIHHTRRVRFDLMVMLIILCAFFILVPENEALGLYLYIAVTLLVTVYFSWRRLQDQKIFHLLMLESNLIDPLTHTKNNLGLEQAMEQEAARSQRHQSAFTLLVLALDDFASVQDVYGHKAANRVLAHVATLLGKSLRITDTVGRHAGAKFMVILSNTAAIHGTLVAERLRSIILDKPMILNSEVIQVSVSIGVAEYGINTGSIDQLISHADEAMRNAKQKGKNQVVCWER